MNMLFTKENKRAFSFILTISLIVSLFIAPLTAFAVASTMPSAVSIVNNAGINDIAQVSKLRPGDIVRVYQKLSDVPSVNYIAMATVKPGQTFVRFDIRAGLDPLGNDAYFTVTSLGKEESSGAAITYKAEPGSVAPLTRNILVTNNENSVMKDKVDVSGLRSGDIVKVYQIESYNFSDLLGQSAPVGTRGKAEVLLTKPLDDGLLLNTVWVSVTNSGRGESALVESATYQKPPDITTGVGIEIEIVNNFGGANDVIRVSGLFQGDIVEVFEDGASKSYGKATVGTRRTEVEIKARPELISAGGKVYALVTTPGKSKHTTALFSYTGQAQSSPVAITNLTNIGSVTSADGIYIKNNAYPKLDEIIVKNLSPGDTVRIFPNYSSGGALNNKELKSVSVSSGKTVATINLHLPEIVFPAISGTIQVMIIESGFSPSELVVVDYWPAVTTDTTAVTVSAVTNNAIISDEIFVTGVTDKDTINVFVASVAAIGSKIAEPSLISGNTGKVLKGTSSAAVKLVFPKENASTGGIVYLQITTLGENPSPRIAFSYPAEVTSDNTGVTVSGVENNLGAKDKLIVKDSLGKGLTRGAVIRIYPTTAALSQIIQGGYKIAQGTASGDAFVVGFPTKEAGSVYLTITETGKAESPHIQIDYGPEPKTATDSAVTATAVNVSGPSDYIKFKGLTSGAIVRVYNTSNTAIDKKVIGVGTEGRAPDIKTEATVLVKLNATGGSVFFSVENRGYVESDREEIIYGAEGTSTSIDAIDIGVINNINTLGVPDIVTVSVGSLTSPTVTNGSLINVYKFDGLKLADVLLGSGKVTVKEIVAGSIDIKLLGKNLLATTGGNIFVSHKELINLESNKTIFNYGPETLVMTSTAGVTMVAINNPGNRDYILVYGLTGGAVVTITYKLTDAPGAKDSSTSATVPVGQSQVAFILNISEAQWNNTPLIGARATVLMPGLAVSAPIFLFDHMVKP